MREDLVSGLIGLMIRIFCLEYAMNKDTIISVISVRITRIKVL